MNQPWTIDEDLFSGTLNGHDLRLKHATIIRMYEKNFQVQFPRADSTTNHIIELRAVVVYIQEFWGETIMSRAQLSLFEIINVQ